MIKHPVQGPELPVEMTHHSLVQINSTVSLLIGGIASSDYTGYLIAKCIK